VSVAAGGGQVEEMASTTSEPGRGVVVAWRERLRMPRPGARLWGFGAYLLVALALTLPAWRNPAMEWPGIPGDPSYFMGCLGWFPFALGHGLNPLLDTYVNLPQGSNMMWNTSVPLLAVAMWPVTALFGVVVSYNVALLLALALDGWCTFLWLRRHVRHVMEAWLGGLLMILGPYASTQATAHIGLLLFFPVPLLIIATETVISHPEHSSFRWGAFIGLLAAAQMLLSEEILILTVLAVGTTIAISALLHPSRARVLVVPLAKTLGVAVLLCLVITGVPLAYQLLGPDRITGLVQPPGVFVTDVVNLGVPNGYTALAPPFTQNLSNQWSGGALEGDAYIGIPLLLVSLWTFRRWRRDRWLWIVGCGTAAALVWSLGPSLHIDGFTNPSLPLPGRLFTYLPGLNSLLPSRFALFIDLGLAVVVAVFTDRTVLQGRRYSRVVGGASLLLVCATLAPNMPIPAWSGATPRYFLAGGDISRLPAGTTALVVPFGAYSELTLGPLLWQAQSDFRVRMVSAALYTGGPDGMSSGLPSVIQMNEQHPWSLPSSTPSTPSGTIPASLTSNGEEGTTLACVMDALESSLPTTPCGGNTIRASRSDLHALGVSVIIMGPMAYGTEPALQRPMEDFLTQLAGAPPRVDQGVMVWSYPG
jgi:hypothetical protein